MLGLTPKDNFVGGNKTKSKVHREFVEFLTKQMGRKASSWADMGRVVVHQLCPHISMKMFV